MAEPTPSYTFQIVSHLEGEYYKCQMIGNGGGQFMCALACHVPTVPATIKIRSFDFNMTTTSQYVLRTYCRAPVKLVTSKGSVDTFATVTEDFDSTLNTFFKRKANQNQITTPRKDRVLADVANIMRKLITGAKDLQIKFQKTHDMNPDHIFLVGDQLRFAHFDLHGQNSTTCHRRVFDLFKKFLPRNLTGELLHFIGLNTSCRSAQFLFYMHPAISNGKRRCELGLHTYDTAITLGRNPAEEIEALSVGSLNYAPILVDQNWKAKVNLKRLKKLKNYRVNRCTVQKYVKFSRAAIEHCNDMDVMMQDPHNPDVITYEQVDDELSGSWQDFMILWFDFCLRQSYFDMFHFNSLNEP